MVKFWQCLTAPSDTLVQILGAFPHSLFHGALSGLSLRGSFVFQLFTIMLHPRAHGAVCPHSSLLPPHALVLPLLTSCFTPLFSPWQWYLGPPPPHQFCSCTQYWASSHGSFPSHAFWLVTHTISQNTSPFPVLGHSISCGYLLFTQGRNPWETKEMVYPSPGFVVAVVSLHIGAWMRATYRSLCDSKTDVRCVPKEFHPSTTFQKLQRWIPNSVNPYSSTL